MTEAEKLKSTLTAIFKRKGHDGRYTRLFENLDPSQREFLLKEVSLHAGELPVIGSAESQGNWLIVTTERIVWHLKGKTRTLSVHDVRHVKADFPKMVVTGVRKDQLHELQIETVGHEQCTIEVEEGAPLMGVWNALMNLGARNRRTEKEQSKVTGQTSARHVTVQKCGAGLREVSPKLSQTSPLSGASQART